MCWIWKYCHFVIFTHLLSNIWHDLILSYLFNDSYCKKIGLSQLQIQPSEWSKFNEFFFI